MAALVGAVHRQIRRRPPDTLGPPTAGFGPPTGTFAAPTGGLNRPQC